METWFYQCGNLLRKHLNGNQDLACHCLEYLEMEDDINDDIGNEINNEIKDYPIYINTTIPNKETMKKRIISYLKDVKRPAQMRSISHLYKKFSASKVLESAIEGLIKDGVCRKVNKSIGSCGNVWIEYIMAKG